jgi:hypothetical protein
MLPLMARNTSRFVAENTNYRLRFMGTSRELQPADLKDCGVLFYAGVWDPVTPAEIETVVKFVENGGGMLLVGLGWSYSSDSDSNLDNYPMNKVGKPFGIQFADGSLEDPTDNLLGTPTSIIFRQFCPDRPSPPASGK